MIYFSYCILIIHPKILVTKWATSFWFLVAHRQILVALASGRAVQHVICNPAQNMALYNGTYFTSAGNWDAEIFLNNQVKITNFTNNASPNNEICTFISNFMPVWMKLCQLKQADLLFSASLHQHNIAQFLEGRCSSKFKRKKTIPKELLYLPLGYKRCKRVTTTCNMKGVNVNLRT